MAILINTDDCSPQGLEELTEFLSSGGWEFEYSTKVDEIKDSIFKPIWLKDVDIFLFIEAVQKEVYTPGLEGLKLFIKHNVKS